MTSPFNGIKVPSTGGKVDVNATNPGEIVTQILPYIFGAAGIVLVFMIISSGFSMMTSAGDPKKMQMAQGKLTNAVIGILVLFLSFFIVPLVAGFLGIDINYLKIFTNE